LMLTIVSFSLSQGASWTLPAVIQTLLPRNYSTMTVGIIGVLFLGSGIIGGILGTMYLELKSGGAEYDPIIKACVLASFISTVALALLIEHVSQTIIFVLNALTGLGLIAFVPFAAQSLIESSFPTSETISINLLLFSAQIFSLAANFLATASFIGDEGMWVIVGMQFPSFVYILFVFKTHYNRRAVEMNYSVSLEKDEKYAGKKVEMGIEVGNENEVEKAKMEENEVNTINDIELERRDTKKSIEFDEIESA